MGTRATITVLAVLAVASTACIGKRSADRDPAKAGAKANAAAKPVVASPPAFDEPPPAVAQPVVAEIADPAKATRRPNSGRQQFESRRLEAATLKTGDLVFVQSAADYATALGTVMPGEFNHVGLVFVTSDGPQVISAAKKLDQFPYDRWIRESKASRVVVKRLAGSEALLTSEKMLPLKRFSFSSRGREYDYGFDWEDSTLYASEYIYKAFEQGPQITLGERKTLASLGVTQQNVQTVRAKHESQLSLQTKVVTPMSIFEDKRLTVVFDNRGPRLTP